MNGVSLTMQDEPDLKRYYTTKEVAASLCISYNVVRGYIKALELDIPKDSGNELLFSKEHMAKLTEFVSLLRVQGFTVWGAKRYLDRGRKL